jgi:hypothetical protein
MNPCGDTHDSSARGMTQPMGYGSPLSCKKCGPAITESAKMCPGCGAKVNRINLPIIVVGSLLGFLVLIYVLGVTSRHLIPTRLNRGRIPYTNRGTCRGLLHLSQPWRV